MRKPQNCKKPKGNRNHEDDSKSPPRAGVTATETTKEDGVMVRDHAEEISGQICAKSWNRTGVLCLKTAWQMNQETRRMEEKPAPNCERHCKEVGQILSSSVM